MILEGLDQKGGIFLLMKNGRLYNGTSGDEVAPAKKKLDRSEWESKSPAITTGVKE